LPISCVQFFETAQLQNIGIALDLYHFFAGGENTQSICLFTPLIKHVHIAGSMREFPITLTSQVLECLTLLRSSGYDLNVSIETSLEFRDRIVGTIIPELRSLGF
jgi:sugar phosphate isomerase/epimerase